MLQGRKEQEKQQPVPHLALYHASCHRAVALSYLAARQALTCPPPSSGLPVVLVALAVLQSSAREGPSASLPFLCENPAFPRPLPPIPMMATGCSSRVTMPPRCLMKCL
ncbi:unnamed protein product [Urochloa humidicola]